MKSFYFNQNIKVKIYENFNLLKDEIVNLFIKEFNKGLCIVSGGNTPKKIYEKISTSNDLGANIKILLADDRLVSNSNEMSNYQMLLNNLLIDYKNNYPISYYDELELSNLKSLQKKVEIILKKNKIYSSFLGIGEDGHTASLFPEIANFKTDFNSFIIKNDFDNFKRFTLSYKTIMMSKKIIFIVTGHKKNKILLDFFRGNHSFDKHPFHMIAANHKNVEFHCDIEAGKNLKIMKAIIFDFDGVILDSVNVKTKAFELLYKDYGPEIQKKVVKYHLDHGGISRFEKFKFYHKNFLNKEIGENELSLMGSKFSSLVFEKVCSSNYISGALEFLNFSSKKYLTFICTGTPYDEIIKVLDYKKLDKYFDHVYGSPMTKTEIIKKIQEKYKISNKEILFIGDAMTDYNASFETDVDFIGVKNNDTQFPKNVTEVDDLMKIKKIKNL